MGARQVGKTTLIKSFGEDNYSQVAYFNFERQTELHQIFQQTKDPQRILDSLALLHGTEIVPRTTLLFFDEIQECSEALISLKYFQEEAAGYSIIAAGSLLGLTLGNDRAFPVGKVEFLDLYPLTFSEYLASVDKKNHEAFQHFLEAKKIENIPTVFFNPIMSRFKEYIISGGMPEPAMQFATTKDVAKTQKIQDQIIRSYQLDFAKYASNATSTRIQYIWNSLPSQLSKENKKFIYRVVKKGARAREYEEAITWLTQAALVSKVYRVSKPGLPLSAYRDLSVFKLYLLDVGLLIRMSGLDPQNYVLASTLFEEFKGSLIENYIAQSLQASSGTSPCYWTSEGIAEVDFIISDGMNIFPLEIKSGMVTKSKSLMVYTKKYNPQLRVRCSARNLSLDNTLLNIPLFYADHIFSLIKKSLIHMDKM